MRVSVVLLTLFSLTVAKDIQVKLEDIERDMLQSEKKLKHQKQYRTISEEARQAKGPQVFYPQQTQKQSSYQQQLQQEQPSNRAYLPQPQNSAYQAQNAQQYAQQYDRQNYAAEDVSQQQQQQQTSSYQIEAQQPQQQQYYLQQTVQQAPQEQQGVRQQYFYPQQQTQKQPGIQYVTDNHLNQPEASYQSYYTPQYYYVPEASTSVQSVVQPKGGVQYVMILPQQQLLTPGGGGSSKAQQYSYKGLYTHVIIPTANSQAQQQQYIVPETATNGAAQVTVEPQSYQVPAEAAAPLVIPTPSTPQYTIQYVPHNGIHGAGTKYTDTVGYVPKTDIFAKLSFSLKKQPKSLLDSYVPSILQYQYYKQQEELAKANSISHFERRRLSLLDSEDKNERYQEPQRPPQESYQQNYAVSNNHK